MEIKRITQTFSYRIEPKLEGGFIARASDPSLPTLEAATREELQQQIQAKIAAVLSDEFQALKLPFGGKQFKLNLQLGPKLNASWQTGSSARQDPAPPASLQLSATELQNETVVNATEGNLANLGSDISNTPITPEARSNWALIRFLLIALAVGALMYFLHLHH